MVLADRQKWQTDGLAEKQNGWRDNIGGRTNWQMDRMRRRTERADGRDWWTDGTGRWNIRMDGFARRTELADTCA